MTASRQCELPVDVEADQVWRERDTPRHWKVASVHLGVRWWAL